MKRYFLIALALLLALLAPGLSCAETPAPVPETGMVPFLCFDWADAAQDADLCRQRQPIYHAENGNGGPFYGGTARPSVSPLEMAKRNMTPSAAGKPSSG